MEEGAIGSFEEARALKLVLLGGIERVTTALHVAGAVARNES
jgi:hypothetical protein